MGLLKHLFAKSANHGQPLVVRGDCFYLTMGMETKKFPHVSASDGSAADMSVLYDDKAGIIQADVVISTKTGTTYRSKVVAERTGADSRFYKLKEMMLDNVALDIASPGHLDLWVNRVAYYDRSMSGRFVGGPAVPTPFAQDEKAFKKDIKHHHDSLLWKAERYFAAKKERKFWFGK